MKSHNELDSDLAESMIAITRQPLLVLDGELRVEKANPAFYDLFNVTPGGTCGRLIYHLGNEQWNIPALRHLLKRVLGGEEHVDNFRVEHQFEDIGRRVMLINARRMETEEAHRYILLAINDTTDLEQAWFELEGQKEYGEKLLDSLREAVIVLGWDLRVKHANETFFETFQVRPEETEGRMIYDLGNGQWNIPELRLLLEDILPTQNSFDDYEVVHDFETIGRRTMHLNGRRLDHIDLIVLAIRDVTEEVQIEHARIRLASIVESSDDAIVSKDLDGIITSWNRSAERLFGFLAEEVIGKPITIIIPPERHHEEDMILGRIRRGESVEHYETVRQRKDGRLLDISLTVSPIRRDDGRVIGASKIARDITAKKEIERLLRRQADLLDQSHDAILSWKIGDGITYWSRGAEKLYGYTSEEAIGRISHELLQTRAHIAMQDVEAHIAQQGSWYGELTHITRDGREIVVESRLVRVDYDGELYALETNRDITERKLAEEELRKSEERFKSSIIQSPVPTILFDDREQILAISQSWLKAAGGIPAAELHRIGDWTTRAYGERSDEVLELARGVIATEPQARTDEMTILTRGGDKRVWSFVTSSLGAQSDGRRLFVSVAQDVTDRKAYEERISLLMREARHRTKNILGLVQAIARQTATGNAQDFIGRFSERIQALAANQDLLVRHEWQRIDVKDLVQAQLGPFADLIGTRINFDGPRLYLNAVAAQAIGLALHELATNASKYGALSTETGRVDVNWQLDDDTYTMGWIERNGPPVRPPDRRGFGSTVTESMVKQALGGEAKLDYAPSGLQWRLTCPAAGALEGHTETAHRDRRSRQVAAGAG